MYMARVKAVNSTLAHTNRTRVATTITPHRRRSTCRRSPLKVVVGNMLNVLPGYVAAEVWSSQDKSGCRPKAIWFERMNRPERE